MKFAPKSHLYIGQNTRTGELQYLTPEMRKTHMHTIGRTGTGKTYFLEGMIRGDILAGRGVCVIDMLGNLYPRLLRFCAFHGLSDKTLLFDPTESDFDVVPGLNYLQRFGNEDLGVVSTTAMMGIERVFREEEADVKPLWERFGLATLKPLAHSGLALTEVEFFADPSCKTFRKNILSTYPKSDPGVLRNWYALDQQRKDEAYRLTMVVVNRGHFFSTTEMMRRICGQTRSTIDWPEVMDQGKVVLINLGNRPDKTTLKMSQALGVILVHQILSAGRLRRVRAGGRGPKPFYVYADEFGEIVCGDFTRGLDTLRQFNVRFILANQRLSQLRTALNDDDLIDAVMTNAGCKVVFNSGTRDTEELAQELYLEEIGGNRIKYQGYSTFFEPILEKVKLTAHVSSTGKSDTRTEPGASFSESVTSDGLGGDPRSTTTGFTIPRPTSSQSSESSDGVTEQEAYITRHEERREPQTPVYSTPEEELWRIRQILGSQPKRHAIFRYVYDAHAVPIFTPEVREMYPTRENLLRFKELVYRKNNYLSSAEVDKQIEHRLRTAMGTDYSRLLEAYQDNSHAQNTEEDESRWERYDT